MKTSFLQIDPFAPDDRLIGYVARMIRAGKVVIFPTETVYGLGGDGGNPEVVKRIYRIKGRGGDKPLARLVGGWEELKGIEWGRGHRKLAELFWPGPLTLILRLADGSRQGIRFPDQPFLQEVIRRSGVLFVATSANLSGKPEAASGEEARRLFSGKVDLILDGGEVSGRPSTVCDLTVSPEKILREGPIPRAEIEKVLRHEKG